ncbi:MAG: hypothetical protein FWD71_20985 [Oscillospiraceae bacterium]|nr:hypothetical protein [Oscillospiraceae bacterium]
MLEIKPIQAKEEQKEICALCKVEFDPDCLAYSAKENGVLLGVSQFRILGKYAVIYDLANAVGADDLEALILMGKATLNFIDLCGVKDVIIKTENRNLPKILGFKKDADGVYKLNLEGYFDSPCQKDNRK